MDVTWFHCPRCGDDRTHRSDEVGIKACVRCGWEAAVGVLRREVVLVVFLRRAGLGQGRVLRIERAA